MGTTAISAHVELPWKGRTSDETFLDEIWGKMLAACGFLGRTNSYVGSTCAPMFQDVANTCFGSKSALWLGVAQEPRGVVLDVIFQAPPLSPQMAVAWLLSR